MGIRDSFYYDWAFVQPVSATPTFAIATSSLNKIVVDVSGVLWGIGTFQSGGAVWTVVKSKDLGRTWTVSDTYSHGALGARPLSIVVNTASNAIVVGGNSLAASSQNYVKRTYNPDLMSWSLDFDTFHGIEGTPGCTIEDMVYDSSGQLYAIGYGSNGAGFGPASQNGWVVRGFSTLVETITGSSTGDKALFFSGGNLYYCATTTNGAVLKKYISDNVWQLIDGRSDMIYRSIAGGNNGAIYVAGISSSLSSSGLKKNFGIIRTGTATSGSFSTSLVSGSVSGSAIFNQIALDSRGYIYVVGSENLTTAENNPSISGNFLIKRSIDGGTTWTTSKSVNRKSFLLADAAQGICIDSNDNIFIPGSASGDNVVMFGNLQSNSSSLGRNMLATTFSYKTENAYDPTANTYFKLNNIAEFPHSSGLFQMRNMVLGTRDSGRIGDTDNNIIQIKHIGSVVKVLWPKQDSILKPIKGFGDFSAGERPGKLSATFQPGQEMDVTPYDHVCLYAYLSKEVSGTLDDVIIQIERKPTNDNAFTVDQSVAYSLSGSKTEARLTDIEYKKQIDYGDLSINKIGFPIDIPLTNTKMLRVSAKHRLGQSNDVNKNLIIWARFILSSKDTQET